MSSEVASIERMQCAVHEAADLLTTSTRWKVRVSAVSRAFGLGWSRTKSFYYGYASTVRDHEGRNGRRVLAELKAKRAANEELNSIQSTIHHLMAVDEDFYSKEITSLRCVLHMAGVQNRPVDEAGE